MYLTGMGNVNY